MGKILRVEVAPVKKPNAAQQRITQLIHPDDEIRLAVREQYKRVLLCRDGKTVDVSQILAYTYGLKWEQADRIAGLTDDILYIIGLIYVNTHVTRFAIA